MGISLHANVYRAFVIIIGGPYTEAILYDPLRGTDLIPECRPIMESNYR